jgi:hypothetical protein
VSSRQEEASRFARFLPAIFCAGCFGAFFYRNRLLFPCGADGFAKRSFNVRFVSTDRREKHTTEPVQVGTESALWNEPISRHGDPQLLAPERRAPAEVGSVVSREDAGDTLEFTEALIEYVFYLPG